MNAPLYSFFSLFCELLCKAFSQFLVIFQVDADYKLQDMKKNYKELEMKAKGYKKKLDDLEVAFVKHMEQYVLVYKVFSGNLVCLSQNVSFF